GGIIENIPRILPHDVVAEVDVTSWPRGALFDWLQANGNVDQEEMLRVFNCGIGMVVVLDPSDVGAISSIFTERGERVFKIGTVQSRRDNEHQTRLLNI
ncbi:MAG: AIR synthase-related protein, partial [Betaproteobacteria bacterium]